MQYMVRSNNTSRLNMLNAICVVLYKTYFPMKAEM